MRQHFYEVSLEYVFKVQEVQERKMFEFVEPVSERSRSLSLQIREDGGSGGAPLQWGGCEAPAPLSRGRSGGSKCPGEPPAHGALSSVAVCMETFQISVVGSWTWGPVAIKVELLGWGRKEGTVTDIPRGKRVQE